MTVDEAKQYVRALLAILSNHEVHEALSIALWLMEREPELQRMVEGYPGAATLRLGLRDWERDHPKPE
jgi:hypothetical protein